MRLNEVRPPSSPNRRLFVFRAVLSRHQGYLLKNMRRRRLLGRERQLQVTGDPVDDSGLSQESNDPHPAAAAGAEERIHLVELTDYLCPALGGKPR